MSCLLDEHPKDTRILAAQSEATQQQQPQKMEAKVLEAAQAPAGCEAALATVLSAECVRFLAELAAESRDDFASVRVLPPWGAFCDASASPTSPF